MATTAKGQQRLVILGCGAYTMEKGGKAQRETPPPPPAASPRACVVPASCLRHACNEGETTWAPLPPPPTHPRPPEGGGSEWGGGAKSDPPPEDNAAG